MFNTFGSLTSSGSSNPLGLDDNQTATDILRDSSRYEAQNIQKQQETLGDLDEDSTIVPNPWKYLLFAGCFILGTFIAKMSKKR